VISSTTLRVNYSETDQMGVVYHANYLIWFDRARTELMRETGLTYKELEQQGVYLAVSEISVRYRAAARYDDLVQVRCWVRELASRRVSFGYAVERARRASYSPPARHHSSPSRISTRSRAFRRMSLTCSSRFPIPWTCKTLMLSIVIVTTPRFRFNS